LSGRKIRGAFSSACVDPRNVGYICKSSIETWQVETLNSKPASVSTSVWEVSAAIPGQRSVSWRGVGKWKIRHCSVSYQCRPLIIEKQVSLTQLLVVSSLEEEANFAGESVCIKYRCIN